MNGDLTYFRMYAAELLADENTGEMTPEELGALLFLWCRCWVNGSIPSDRASVMRLARLPQDRERVLDTVLRRFTPRPGHVDRLISERIEREREEALGAKDQKIRAGKASGEARRKRRSNVPANEQRNGVRTEREQRSKNPGTSSEPYQPASHPSNLPSSLPASQPPAAERKANGAESAAATLPLDRGRLAGFKKTLSEGMGKTFGCQPVPLSVGGQEAEVLEFFQGQLEAVGSTQLVLDCIDAARKSKTGTPSSLAWFVPWLRRLPMPKQAALPDDAGGEPTPEAEA